MIFDLAGVAGGVWQVGKGEAGAVIHMDALDFAIFSSGRFSPAEARARATLSGDVALAESALDKILVLF